MNALTKAVISQALIEDLALSKSEAKIMVEGFFEAIKQTLEQGSSVKLSSFGNFILRDKAERPGRNPKTGKEIPVKARRVVTFRPGIKLKAKIERHYANGKE